MRLHLDNTYDQKHRSILEQVGTREVSLKDRVFFLLLCFSFLI